MLYNKNDNIFEGHLQCSSELGMEDIYYGRLHSVNFVEYFGATSCSVVQLTSFKGNAKIQGLKPLGNLYKEHYLTSDRN